MKVDLKNEHMIEMFSTASDVVLLTCKQSFGPLHAVGALTLALSWMLDDVYENEETCRDRAKWLQEALQDPDVIREFARFVYDRAPDDAYMGEASSVRLRGMS